MTICHHAGAQYSASLYGSAALGLLGGKWYKIPNLDKMASESVNFDHRYAIHSDGREFLYALEAPFGEHSDISGEVASGVVLTAHRKTPPATPHLPGKTYRTRLALALLTRLSHRFEKRCESYSIACIKSIEIPEAADLAIPVC